MMPMVLSLGSDAAAFASMLTAIPKLIYTLPLASWNEPGRSTIGAPLSTSARPSVAFSSFWPC